MFNFSQNVEYLKKTLNCINMGNVNINILFVILINKIFNSCIPPLTLKNIKLMNKYLKLNLYNTHTQCTSLYLESIAVGHVRIPPEHYPGIRKTHSSSLIASTNERELPAEMIIETWQNLRAVYFSPLPRNSANITRCLLQPFAQKRS